MFASISIDVDSLRFYRAIHGLGSRPEPNDPIYTVALDRFFGLLEEHQIPATLFLIGADAPEQADRFAPGKKLGCEIASHSFDHDYRLTERTVPEIVKDLVAADAALRPIYGEPIKGFRAPGYNVTSELLGEVRDLGYRYDSSLLPAPAYFGARAAAIGFYGLIGRPSRSLPGDVRQFFGPLDPYWMDPEEPWISREKAAARLVELPMAVEPFTRAPIIGTTWGVMPPWMREAIAKITLKKLKHFNFELHAIDFLDRSDGEALAELSKSQRDLTLPASQKIAAFSGLFRRLKDERPVVTLAQAAEMI